MCPHKVALSAVVLALTCLFTATLYYGQEPIPVEPPPGSPVVGPTGLKYAFKNGITWGNPQIGYCCRDKWDFPQEHKRLKDEIRDYLRVYGEEGEEATVTQLDGQNENFFLWPLDQPIQAKTIVQHYDEDPPDTPHARFTCTGGGYGFKKEPLKIKVIRNDGRIDEGFVEAGGTFGIRAQRDPYNWGFASGWSQRNMLEVETEISGLPATRTVGLASGYIMVAVRTKPDNLRDVVAQASSLPRFVRHWTSQADLLALPVARFL